MTRRRSAAAPAGGLGRAVTPDLVRQALACIPPYVDRETWARLAMAIKSELPSGSGFDLWNDWSARGENYSERDARATWRSVKATGGTTIGTLFGIAKDHGFRFPEGPVQTPAPAAGSQAEAARLAEERRQRWEAEEAEYRRRADQAARDAVELWAEGHEQGRSPYLERKGVQPHGVRFLADGTLLVPMRDAAGELQNVQRIAPQKPAGAAPDKRYLPGGRKSGLWHQLGQVEGAPALLLAEGYATAATLHEATGRPVAVAFDAGNMVHVAKALRALLPAALLLVCGDDDRATELRTGRNPGRDKAIAAARAAHAEGAPAGVVFPAELAGDGTDFNDLAAQAGLEAVRLQVEQAAASPSIPKARRGAKSGAGEAFDGADDGDSQPEVGEPAGDERDPFSVDERGVWYTARDSEGNAKRPMWVCAPLQVAARTRADDSNGWGYLVDFTDPDGNAKAWAMPSAMLSGEGAEWAGRLRDMGLRMAPGTRARNLIAQYIDTRNPRERVTCTDRVGWHGPVYVLPSGSIASHTVTAEGRRYVFQTDSGMEDTFRRHGTLAEWRTGVAKLAEGNSRLVFALCCAFAGPALRLAGMESGGFHFRGDSSQGKTTALRVAASVWGRPSFMQRWRATSNALESIAAQHCDCLLVLDELGQLDPREAGDCAYLLANEQEKGRSTRGALLRKRRTWRLLFLSSGEVSLADHMAEAGKRTRAGMEVRMADIPLDAGAGMGGIEKLHQFEGPAAMADAIMGAAARYYGTAGRAWLEWCCEHHEAMPEQLQALVDEYRDQMVPEASAEQVRRVGNRFGLVAAAGELAARAGITGWPAGHAAWAVRQCFNAWLAARGHMDNGEDASMLRQVRRFLELNGEGRFSWWHRAMDDHTPKTLNRAGFRRLLGEDGKPVKNDGEHMREYGERMTATDGERARVEFIVLREVFRGEVCGGFDSEAVAKLLRHRGHLVHEADRFTMKHRLPGIGPAATYHIKPSIFDDDL